jgi:hypothetical protein
VAELPPSCLCDFDQPADPFSCVRWWRAKFVQHAVAPSLGIAFAGIRKLDDLVKAAGMTAN